MSGTKFIGFGILLLVLGITAVGLYYAKIMLLPVLLTGGAFVAGIGAILMFFGIISLTGKEYATPGLRAGDVNLFSTGLIRCMVAISIADKVLDDNEIAEIARIHKHLTKNDIAESVIKETAAEMMEQGATIQEELKVIRGSLDTTLKQKLIIASLYILAADGDMDESELIMLEHIREGLGIPLKQLERTKKDFLAKRDLT
jgi:uncharacterized tellurite resistance protein B-like protein